MLDIDLVCSDLGDSIWFRWSKGSLCSRRNSAHCLGASTWYRRKSLYFSCTNFTYGAADAYKSYSSHSNFSRWVFSSRKSFSKASYCSNVTAGRRFDQTRIPAHPLSPTGLLSKVDELGSLKRGFPGPSVWRHSDPDPSIVR